MPTQAEYDRQAIAALQAQSPMRRAIQQGANVLTNFGNTVTGGALGAVGDFARGTPLGTTGDQIRAQLNAQSDQAAPITDALGILTGGAVLARGAGAAVRAAGGIRPAAAALARSFTPEVIGTRAAALGARATPAPGRVIAGVAAPLAVAAGVSALAGNPDTPAVQPNPNNPRDGLTARGDGPVEQAMMQGREARTVQDDLTDTVRQVLNNNPSLAQLQTIQGLLPSTIKRTQSDKDALFGQTSKLSDALLQQELVAAQAAATSPEDYAKRFQSALRSKFQRDAGMLGFDPGELVQAQLLQPGEE